MEQPTTINAGDITTLPTNTTTPYDPSYDLFIVIVWSVMLSYGLLANLLILIGIFRSATMRQATSYWLIISLSLCDVMMVLISLLHLVPSTYFHDRYVEVKSVRNIVAIFFYDIFWYTAVLKLGLMAINRFVSIVYPMEYKGMFSPKRTALMIASMYTSGVAVSIPILFPCCYMMWDHEQWLTIYEPGDSKHAYVDMSVNGLTVIVMVYCYAIVIRKVRESRKAMAKYRLTLEKKQAADVAGNAACTSVTEQSETEQLRPLSRSISLHPPRGAHVNKRELRLFLQFFIVSLVFLLTWATWQLLGYVSLSKWINFTGTSFFFVNNSVNPTVYLIFNTSLKREVKRLLCGGCARAVEDHRGIGAQNNNNQRRRGGNRAMAGGTPKHRPGGLYQRNPHTSRRLLVEGNTAVAAGSSSSDSAESKEKDSRTASQLTLPVIASPSVQFSADLVTADINEDSQSCVIRNGEISEPVVAQRQTQIDLRDSMKERFVVGVISSTV